MDLDKLEHLALQATKGPWRNGIGGVVQLTDGGKGYPLDYYPDCADVVTTDGADKRVATNEDLDYIAAMSPDVCLALIRVARAAEKFDDPPPFGDVSALHADLRAALDALGGGE